MHHNNLQLAHVKANLEAQPTQQQAAGAQGLIGRRGMQGNTNLLQNRNQSAAGVLRCSKPP